MVGRPDDFVRPSSFVDDTVGILLPKMGVDMPPLIDRMHDKIWEIYVKDADAVEGKNFVRFGTGIVDCSGIIQHCVDCGYTGYLTLELSLIDRATMLDDLRQGLEIT